MIEIHSIVTHVSMSFLETLQFRLVKLEVFIRQDLSCTSFFLKVLGELNFLVIWHDIVFIFSKILLSLEVVLNVLFPVWIFHVPIIEKRLLAFQSLSFLFKFFVFFFIFLSTHSSHFLNKLVSLSLVSLMSFPSLKLNGLRIDFNVL
jgi:hypothetical protein